MDSNTTIHFDISEVNDEVVKSTLRDVLESLEERGYNPINQIVGYIISGDLGYISSYKEARTTFSTSEEFLRRIYRLKRRGQLIRATMLADLKASRKTVNLYTFIANVFDEVYLSENHSKVILIQNARWQVSICTSQNQTRGNRVESGIITTDPAVFIQLRERYAHIINTNAIQLDGLFNGTT